jgi:predicted acylesterase/phospholipase RssA
MARIGVALSGGGHRATIWGIGVLIYLADAGRQADVGVIASVSGGSIANGVVAHEMDYARASAHEVRSKVRPLLRHVAYTGLFFWGPSTNAFVITVLSLLGLASWDFSQG